MENINEKEYNSEKFAVKTTLWLSEIKGISLSLFYNYFRCSQFDIYEIWKHLKTFAVDEWSWSV